MTPTAREAAPLSVNLAGIPLELAERRQWVLWKYIDGKKVPYEVSGFEASSTNPESWSTLEIVAERYVRGGFDGIGFVFAEDDPFAGVDLDGCRNPDTGEIAPWAREVVNKLDSYCEISPSGTGVKLFVCGRSPFDRGKKTTVDAPRITGKHPGIELYDKARYFCVTGQSLEGSPETIEEADLGWLRARFWPATNGNGHRQPAELASDGAVERARKYAAEVDPTTPSRRRAKPKRPKTWIEYV